MVPFKFYTAVYLFNEGFYKLESERICVFEVDFFGNTFSIILHCEYVLEAIFLHRTRIRIGNIMLSGRSFSFAKMYLDFAFASSRESMLQGI